MSRVYGDIVDDKTRCLHYHLELDVIAIKFRCCGKYYPCYKCHAGHSSHEIDRWPEAELATERVVLCGECKSELTFAEYALGDSQCVRCGVRQNPGCRLHYGIYFDLPDTSLQCERPERL